MLTFELINPSDGYTLQAESFDVASVAALIVGQGRYGLKQLNGNLHMPIMILGVDDRWAQSIFEKDITNLMKDVIDNKRDELIQCLESFFIGSNEDREIYETSLDLIPTEEAKEAFRKNWHDKKRTSINDIGTRAYTIAQNLRKKAKI